MVKIFGRKTPLELGFMQVEKSSQRLRFDGFFFFYSTNF